MKKWCMYMSVNGINYKSAIVLGNPRGADTLPQSKETGRSSDQSSIPVSETTP